MSIVPITIVPNPVLRQKAHAIEKIDDAVRADIEDLVDTFYDKPNGVGLAANQIGILKRFLIIDVDHTEKNGGKKNPVIMINPVILRASEERSVYLEGCFSIPDQYAEVERPALVRVQYQDLDGKTHELEREGTLLNHVIQHEIDHLDGVLFIDYLSSLKRNMILRKVKKLTRDDQIDML